MLNLSMLTAAQIRQRSEALMRESIQLEEARCHGLARLKLRDAAFYRRQLRPATA